MSALSDLIDLKAAEYERDLDNLDMPIKADTLGKFLEPFILFHFEREDDRR